MEPLRPQLRQKVALVVICRKQTRAKITEAVMDLIIGVCLLTVVECLIFGKSGPKVCMQTE